MLSEKQLFSDAALTMFDVRDVAKIHVQALTHPDTANYHFILSALFRKTSQIVLEF